MSAQDWSLREEFLALIRKWQLAAVIFVLGAAAGWLSGDIWPARFEARAALKVHFNSDAIYLTPDDYKNWQVEELEDLALSDSVLQETLAGLQSGDDAWKDRSVADLRAAASPRWRNAGAWYLVATLPDADQAAALVEAWRRVLYETALSALDRAAAFNALDRRLDELSRHIGQADADIVRIEAFRTEIEAWMALEETEGEHGLRAAGIAARLDRSPELGIVLLPNFPDAGAPLSEIADWGERVQAALDDALHARQDERAGLLETYDLLAQDWLAEKEASLGLSAYLSLEWPDDPAVEVERQYDRGLLSIAGGIVAVLVWVSVSLAQVRPQEVKEDAG